MRPRRLTVVAPLAGGVGAAMLSQSTSSSSIGCGSSAAAWWRMTKTEREEGGGGRGRRARIVGVRSADRILTQRKPSLRIHQCQEKEVMLCLWMPIMLGVEQLGDHIQEWLLCWASIMIMWFCFDAVVAKHGCVIHVQIRICCSDDSD